jgi:hypothetical protein
VCVCVFVCVVAVCVRVCVCVVVVVCGVGCARARARAGGHTGREPAAADGRQRPVQVEVRAPEPWRCHSAVSIYCDVVSLLWHHLH